MKQNAIVSITLILWDDNKFTMDMRGLDRKKCNFLTSTSGRDLTVEQVEKELADLQASLGTHQARETQYETERQP